MKMNTGEMFMLGFRGKTVPRWLKDFAQEFGLGGVILFDYDCLDKKYERNVYSPEQVKDLCAEIHALPSRPMVYVDQEGGKVRRLKEKYGFAPLASAKNFPALDPQTKIAQLSGSLKQMKEVGVDCDLAPVIDVDINPKNPDLGAVERCYSPDPKVVLENAMLVANAGKEYGIELCLKHFPGCGAATVNSHLDLMDLSDVVTEEQVNVFKTMIEKIPMVLFSHAMVKQWDPKHPMSLSKYAVDLVRSWKPDAILMTDDLQMEGMQKRTKTGEACVLAAKAGLDTLCIGNNMIDEQSDCASFANDLRNAATHDAAILAHIEKSIQRIQKMKARHAR